MDSSQSFIKIPACLVAHCLLVCLNEFLLLFFSSPPYALGMTQVDVIQYSRQEFMILVSNCFAFLHL